MENPPPKAKPRCGSSCQQASRSSWVSLRLRDIQTHSESTNRQATTSLSVRLMCLACPECVHLTDEYLHTDIEVASLFTYLARVKNHPFHVVLVTVIPGVRTDFIVTRRHNHGDPLKPRLHDLGALAMEMRKPGGPLRLRRMRKRLRGWGSVQSYRPH